MRLWLLGAAVALACSSSSTNQIVGVPIDGGAGSGVTSGNGGTSGSGASGGEAGVSGSVTGGRGGSAGADAGGGTAGTFVYDAAGGSAGTSGRGGSSGAGSGGTAGSGGSSGVINDASIPADRCAPGRYLAERDPIDECSYLLRTEAGVVDISWVTLTYSAGGVPPAQTIPRRETGADCSLGAGWYWNPTNRVLMTLCPNTCAGVKSDLNARVDAVVMCP
jgi:hypothetical protein